jgi:hypothetical protein
MYKEFNLEELIVFNEEKLNHLTKKWLSERVSEYEKQIEVCKNILTSDDENIFPEFRLIEQRKYEVYCHLKFHLNRLIDMIDNPWERLYNIK